SVAAPPAPRGRELRTGCGGARTGGAAPGRREQAGRVPDLLHPVGGPLLAAAGDPSQLLPAREQMAFTLGFHIILVPFGVAFTFLMLVANYRGLRHGDETALLLARRWAQVAAVLFAVGAVSATALSFELGLLW